MLECVICARHPHLPDTECSRDCRSRDADLGTICTGCAQRIRDDLDTLVDAWAATESPAFPGGSSGDGRAKSSPLPGGTDWIDSVSYTHLTLPTTLHECRSRWSPYH